MECSLDCSPCSLIANFDESTRVLVRPIGLDMVEVGGPTKCDYRRILVARAQRRRPKGVRAREVSALETIRLVLPKLT